MTLPPGGEWDDARLDAAFTARAAATPPSPLDLERDVLRRVTSVQRMPPRWSWLAAATAAVAILVVVVGSSLIATSQPNPTTPAAAASGHPQPSTRAPSPTLDVLAALGDPMTVSEAIEARASQNGRRELLVKGFLSPVPNFVRCRVASGIVNPTLLQCPLDMRWLMEQPEDLITNGPGPLGLRPPGGPAIQPSFAQIEGGVTFPMPVHGVDHSPDPVVLMGHFNDRRANLCDQLERCLDTFVVDWIVEIDGESQAVSTARGTSATPKDSADVVNALAIGAAPESVVVSRQLLEVGDLAGVEPALANDPTISAWGDRSAPFWLVTTVDLAGDVPMARTFALIDGSDWFAEVTAEGAEYLERSAPEPSAPAQPTLPSADPSAFDGAPTSILGIPVRDIASIQRDRAAAMDALGRTEFAIRAWYLAPNPAVACDDVPPAIHEPRPQCDEARHWLLDDPAQFGEEPGQLRLNPALDHYTPVINPLVPIDVAFDVGETWSGDAITASVVVLGHFNDHRVDTFAGNLYFIDRRTRMDLRGFRRIARSRSAPDPWRWTDNAAAVIDRIAAVDPREAFADLDDGRLRRRNSAGGIAAVLPDARVHRREPVGWWRRLILEEDERAPRYSVETGYTMDDGTRVWRAGTWTERAARNELDLSEPDANTALIQGFDYSAGITAIRSATTWGPSPGSASRACRSSWTSRRARRLARW